MTPFTLDLDKLSERPLPVNYDFEAAELDIEDDAFQFPGRVTGRVLYTRVGKDVVANGTLQTEVIGTCARCLDPGRAVVNAIVDEQWLKDPAELESALQADEENPALIMAHKLEGDQIELAEIFRELLLSELPDRVLCAETCKGLCPECGANLNREPCRCASAADGGAALPPWKQAIKKIHLDQ